MNSEVRELVKKAERRGWELIDPSGSGHQRLRFPRTGDVVVLPSTPSDTRGLRNATALITRISGRLAPKVGPGLTVEQRNVRRQREKLRGTTARRRTVARLEPCPPKRPAMELAFEDYFDEQDELTRTVDVPKQEVRKVG